VEEIAKIRERIAEMEDRLQAYLDGKPTDRDICAVLIEFNEMKAFLKVVYDSFAIKVGSVLSDDSVVLENGEVERAYSKRRTGWQHRVLASAVADKLSQMAVDMDTGEVRVSPKDLAASMLSYVQPSYWKTTELAKIGINADNYCEAGDTKVSIIVRRKGATDND
jgi:hypothetical protein